MFLYLLESLFPIIEEQMSQESKCRWRANVVREQVSREQMSSVSKCPWGANIARANVRGASVAGANVRGASVVIPYFDTKLSRKILSFPFFLGNSLHITCFLLWLRYFVNHLLHSEMFLVKTIETKKLITFRTEGFYFLCCCQARFS